MDDARLASEMTLDGIARQLETIRADLGGLRSELRGEVGGLKGEMTRRRAELKGDILSLDSRMEQGFRRVDEELNAARIRDEEAHRLLKFGLEAREALRETVQTRFDATDTKHAEEIDLLKDVLRAVSGGR